MELQLDLFAAYFSLEDVGLLPLESLLMGVTFTDPDTLHDSVP